MAIYRGRRRLVSRRTGVALAIAAALTGVLVWAIRREPEPARTARPDPIQALVGVLEIIPVSYERAVRDGAIIAGQEVQYGGAQDALSRGRSLFENARGVIAAQNPATARLVEETLGEIGRAIAARRPPAEVRKLTDRLREDLKELHRKRRAGA